ncbi:PLP-dependent aminotransferase family protein [Leptolyngbya sp. AN02str]|uniref:aminotransferase-like domain-containing protein n=1 Tax=Leptolyngbya sp. AN02str TaxID=3423363 RepID=UPI003D321F44
MKIPLDRRSPQPVYQQIRSRIRRLIESGALQPGDRLPSIRTLAENAQVNKLTVIEAYGVLEAEGLIYARAGAGYFVCQPRVETAHPESTFAPTQDVIIPNSGEISYFDFYMTAIRTPETSDMVMFNSGFTHPVGMENAQRIARRALKQSSNTLYFYDLPQGQLTLRKQIAQLMIQQGLEISPENLIVTNGSMQGIALTMRHYIQPGDWVIVESPTYYGALAILQQLGARIIGIPMTKEGMNLSLLAQYLHSHRPVLIYTMSTLHNPTGITTSMAHRQEMLAIAAQYQCPILEDNAYEGLSFEAVPPPIKALDDQSLVIYAGTFSKTLMPGLRVGYLVATGDAYQPLLESKLLMDLCASTASQTIVSEFLASGHYRRHLTSLRMCNLQGRNTMLAALERYFPPEAKWTVPTGGTFLWVTLPESVPMQQLCHEAAQQQVMITPGSGFFPNQQGYPALRINFSQDPDKIERGISVLGGLIRRYLDEAQ